MEKIRILAVDDNVVNLATIEQELQDTYEVIPVSSGRRALKVARQEKVDLILLDIQMPIMDGIETLKQIRAQENGTTVPVIMLTATHDKATVLEGAKLGIMDYIIKPFDGDDLRQRIEKALKLRGALPMNEEELYQHIGDIAKCLHNGNMKLALTKTEEMAAGYQLDGEVAKRLQAAVIKMKEEDFSAAERIIDRILQMIDQKKTMREGAELLPISVGELNSKLLYIVDDLQHFLVEDAATKLEDLLRYAMPKVIKEKCQKAQKCLREYDDGEAELLIKEALERL